jgi:hypothetical protein
MPPAVVGVTKAVPSVTIIGAPRHRIRLRQPTFHFVSEPPGADFLCKLDRRPYLPCGSPVTLTRQALGSHTFSVIASDEAVGAGPPATYKFFVKPRARGHAGA